MNAAKDCTLQEKLLRCAMALILAASSLASDSWSARRIWLLR